MASRPEKVSGVGLDDGIFEISGMTQLEKELELCKGVL